MESALRLSATVQAGHRIEVTAPELPEGSHVELIVTDPSTEPYRRYPSALEAEYDALIDKELHGMLTDEEQSRLQDVRSVIAEIDRLTLSNDIRIQRLNQIHTELGRLRQQVEALPDV